MSDSIQHIEGQTPPAEVVTRNYAKQRSPQSGATNAHKGSLNVHDGVNFAGAEKLDELVTKTCEMDGTIDPDCVKKAKALFADPSYPPKKLINDLAKGLLSPMGKVMEREQERFERERQ